MSKFFRIWGVVKGVGGMVDGGRRHIPPSPPVLLASTCNKENSNSQSFQISKHGGRCNSVDRTLTLPQKLTLIPTLILPLILALNLFLTTTLKFNNNPSLNPNPSFNPDPYLNPNPNFNPNPNLNPKSYLNPNFNPNLSKNIRNQYYILKNIVYIMYLVRSKNFLDQHRTNILGGSRIFFGQMTLFT